MIKKSKTNGMTICNIYKFRLFVYTMLINSKKGEFVMARYEETKKSGLGTAGLVLGIIGICTSFIPIINNLSFIMGVLAVIFGMIALAKQASKGKTITAIILGILAVVITLNAQKIVSDSINEALDTFNNELDTMSGNKTEEILANNLDVTIGTFEAIKQQYMTDTKLPVKVKNKSSETKSFSIQIEAVDGNGSRINQDTIYVNNLNAGQSQDFEAFSFVTSDKVEALKNATFKIIEVSMY